MLRKAHVSYTFISASTCAEKFNFSIIFLILILIFERVNRSLSKNIKSRDVFLICWIQLAANFFFVFSNMSNFFSNIFKHIVLNGFFFVLLRNSFFKASGFLGFRKLTLFFLVWMNFYSYISYVWNWMCDKKLKWQNVELKK